MKLGRIILKRIGIVFLGILLPLVAVEIFMRVLDVGKSVKFDSTFDRPAVSYLPDGEFRLHPWSRGETNIFRIAVIGDSFTLGSGCQWDDSYPWRLQRLLNLNEGVRPAEVRVFAKAGTSTEVQFNRFFKPMLEWGPDLLILCIYLNDTENWSDRATLNSMREPMNPRVPEPRAARLLRLSRVATWIYHQADELRRMKASREYHAQLYDPDYSGWKLFVGALKNFKEKCSEANIAFVAVIFPSMDDLDRYPFRSIHEKIGNALKAEEIPRLDMLRDFEGKCSLRMQALPYLDCHPSEIAHRIAAQSIFEFLLENKHIDQSYRPRYSKEFDLGIWEGRLLRSRRPLYFAEREEEAEQSAP